MKSNYINFLLIAFLITMQSAFAGETILKGQEANKTFKGAYLIRYTDRSSVPDYVHFGNTTSLRFENFQTWITANFKINAAYGFKLLKTETDKLGFTHYRYQQTFQGYAIQNSMYLLHVRNGIIESMNGEIYNNINPTNSILIDEQTALTQALNKVNATVYKWQIAAEEKHLQAITHDITATYYPKGNLVLLKKNGNFYFCYAFNIYAKEPMSRTLQFVDANSGAIIETRNLIETVGTIGVAHTKFSGIRSIQTDSVAPTTFHLYDATRGLGISTKNLQNTSNYGGAVEFVDNDDDWNNVNVAGDEAATDAHWGAEMTYDFYSVKHNRNSIDNAGLSLNSYIHYNTNYVNAFWDGTEMTYGDGNVSQGFLQMTGLDVCGHEITHGLTSYTAQLGGSGTDECDALNEGYSDIFGTCIERFARPTQWDWLMGADITCNANGQPDGAGLRNVANPALSAAGSLGGVQPQPICYLGTNWDANGEPHNNNGPLIYWFYLLSTGYTPSNITALGVDTASEIAYRTLTVHLTSSATYSDARFYSIVSSSELYGGCSVQTASTTNAWSKVCVGNPYVNSPTTCNFVADVDHSCKDSMQVHFTNNTVNGNSYIWHFGDGTTSTLINPAHTYMPGVYNVKLYSNGGNCGNDSITKNSFINIGPIPTPSTAGVSINYNTTATLTATPTHAGDLINWYAVATGGSVLQTSNSYTTPNLTTTTTYYAEEMAPAPIFHVGPLDNTIGGGNNYTNAGRYLIFDCKAPVTLQSVVVFAQTAGNRIIELRDNLGNVIQTATVNIAAGNNVLVPLNFAVPVGDSLQLGLNASSAVDLYRNNSGASYPYTNGPISITTNSAASGGYYYFFYDWVIKGEDCMSARVPATVTVGANGINEVLNKMGFEYFPNPFNNAFNLQFNKQAFSGKIELINVLGQIVYTADLKNVTSYQIATQNLANGNYLLHLVNDNLNTAVKLLKAE